MLTLIVNLYIIVCLLTMTHMHEVMIAYNCGSHTNITTKYVKYTSDEMFEGLTSRMALKSSLPASIVDEEDRKLLVSERVTDFDAFSYFFKISSRDRYLLVFKFVEVVSRQKGERVFNIKLGDQLIHRVDIFAESGYGNILHKWIAFDLRQDVVYLNKTYPALNAYIYTKRLLKVTFEKVYGAPKIDALMLVKGEDAQSTFLQIREFLNDYLAYEQGKNMVVREYVSEKYHVLPQKRFKKLVNLEEFLEDEQNFLLRVLIKYFWKAICSVVGVGFLMFHEQIYKKITVFHQKIVNGKKTDTQQRHKID